MHSGHGGTADWLGHISRNPDRLLGLDILDLKVAPGGHGLDPLDAKRFHCRCRGLRELAEVEDLVAHRLLGDQLVLRVDSELDVWRAKLIARIEQAARDGDVPASFDPHSLALTLKAATDGLLVAAGSGASNHELRGIVASFLSMWPGR